MNNLFRIKSLLTRLGNAAGMPDLETILNDYEAALNEAVAGNPDYKTKLRRLIEEVPDMRRMVPKKFDAILKGRINDGLRGFRKQVEELEAPAAPAETGSAPDPSHAVTEVKLGEGEAPAAKPFRNMPSLGMD
jgi:hypothetical protein